MLVLWWIGCKAAEVVDVCAAQVLDTGACLPCEGPADCVFTGNPCLDTVYCAHQGTPLAVAELGCSEAVEYRWPPAEACTCVDGVCASTE